MNVRMWLHPATQRNIERLRGDGVLLVGPDPGAMACGEYGPGRMAEPPAIIEAIEKALAAGTALGDSQISPAPNRARSWEGMSSLLPGRLMNRSTRSDFWETDPPGGRAMQLRNRLLAPAQGSRSITGPVALSDPAGRRGHSRRFGAGDETGGRGRATSRCFYRRGCCRGLAPEIVAHHKMKKTGGEFTTLRLVENPDILAEVSKKTNLRPVVVVGFAAETENILTNAKAKLRKKGCDLIIANSVAEGTQTFGGEINQVEIVDADGVESWPAMSKAQVADGIVRRLALELAKRQ